MSFILSYYIQYYYQINYLFAQVIALESLTCNAQVNPIAFESANDVVIMNDFDIEFGFRSISIGI